jgi:hypothetical protein
MPFEDIAQFVANSFDLPYDGRTYTVPAPNARDGLWLQALLDGAESFVLTRAIGAANRKVLGDEEERGAYQLALGTAYQEMVDAGVQWPVLKHAGMTAWLYWCRSPDAAERYWVQLPDGSGKASKAEETEPSSPPDGSPTESATPTAA